MARAQRQGVRALRIRRGAGVDRPQVRAAVEELRDNQQTLWFTGHSLGGALAMLAAARLHFEEPRLTADGVYTFGQPRTCDRALAKEFNTAFTDRMYRFVNNNDIVAQLPPEPTFHHVAALRYIDSKGRVHDAMPVISGLFDRAKGYTAEGSHPPPTESATTSLTST